jgi:hypothetical protein
LRWRFIAGVSAVVDLRNTKRAFFKEPWSNNIDAASYLYEVDVIACEPVRILLIVPAASCTVELASALTSASVQPQPKAARMDVIHQGSYTRGKTVRVHLEIALRISLSR